MAGDELRTLLEQQIALMTDVATGGARIDDVQPEYIERRQEIRERLRELDLEDPNPHPDLWHWYAHWSGNFPKYAERRSYVRRLYQPLIDALDVQDGDDGVPGEAARPEQPLVVAAGDEAQPSGRSGAVRIHDGLLDDLPAVAIPNWDLLGKLEDIIRGAWPAALVSFVAIDRAGSYRAPSIESLNEAVEAAEHDPHEIHIYVDTNGDDRCTVLMQNHRPSRADVHSTSQMVVDHFVARVQEAFREHRQRPPTYEELQERAAYEQMLRDEQGPRYVNVVTDVQPIRKKTVWERARPVLYNPLFLAIGAPLIVGAITAIAVWLF